MVRHITATVIALLWSMPAFGQIDVALSIDPARALIYEPVQAKVVIRNNTGSMLTFDASKDAPRFSFEAERGKSQTVKLIDRSALLFGLKLVPGETKTNLLNLTSLYPLQSLGLYKIRACVEWRDILFVSPAIDLEILRGFEIARVIAGIPGEERAMRVYVLEYLSKEKGEDLYLRIEDDQTKTIYGMHNLGHIVRVRKPEIKVDEAGNVHVLFQSMSMVFVHTAYTPYGVQLFSRNYTDKSNKITLHNLPSGQISVSPAMEPASGPESSAPSTQQPPAKARLGRGGIFGPKSQ